MISVTIVGGFLGAGKTTWLARQLAAFGPTATLIVNDVAPVGVDDRLFDEGLPGAPRVEAIVGGCVCCDRLGELRQRLIAAADRSRRDDRPNAVVIETTGVAALGPLVALLSDDPVLAQNTELAALVVVVDGVDGMRALRHRDLAREQVRLADLLVISKADLVPGDHLAEVAGALEMLNPRARITVAADGVERTAPSFPPEAARHQDADAHPFGHDHDDHTATTQPLVWVRPLPPSTSWAQYAVWLDALVRAHPHRVLRSKGTIDTPAGRLVLQSVGGTIARPIPARGDIAQGEAVMVFITEGIDTALLERSFAAFVPSAAD